MLLKKTRNSISIIGLLFLLPCLFLIIAFALLKLGNENPPKEVSNPDEVSIYLTHKLGPDFFNGVNRGDEFELRLSEVGINDILAHQRWPITLDKLTIKWARVSIDSNGLELVCAIDINKIATTLKIRLSAQIQDDNSLLVELGRVRAGRLPAKFILKRLLKKNLAQNSDDIGEITIEEKLLESLLFNKAFTPEFEFMGSNVLIKDITASKGLLTLKITPTKEQ